MAPVEITPPPGSGLVRQLPFRLGLQAKLRLIVWAAGGKKRAARKMGVYYRNLCRWANDEKMFPTLKYLKKIDEAYTAAFEKRIIHEQRLLRQRTRRKALRTPPDMNISVDVI